MSKHGNRAGTKRLKSEVTIAEIVNWALDTRAPGPDPSWSERRLWSNLTSICRRLTPHWGALSADEVTEASASEYRAARFGLDLADVQGPTNTTPSSDAKKRKRPKTKVARSTVDGELGMLRMLIHNFSEEHRLKWEPTDVGQLIKPKMKQRKPLERADLVRLLWAARGCIYTPERKGKRPTRKGKVVEGLKPFCFVPKEEFIPGQRKALRAHMYRFILISYYAGATADCVVRLRWQGDPDGEESFVDTKEGLLYRLGPDAAPGKQAGMPVPITPRLLTALKSWEAHDARSTRYPYIIHSRLSAKARNTPGTGFRSLRVDAGLPTAEMRQLPLTTGATLMRRGVSMRSAAIYMGFSEDTFAKRFQRFRKDAHAAAKRALEKRAKTVRDIPLRSAKTWRDRQKDTLPSKAKLRFKRVGGTPTTARAARGAEA